MLNGPIGIIGAMDSEVRYLIGCLKECKITKIYGMEFAAGYLCDKPVVVTKCGVGKVNAARCTQYLIDTYKPSAVINTGIGGGIAPGLKVGDAVVADGLVQHDFDVTAFGYAKGYLWTGKDKDKPTVFRPDAKVSDALVKAAESILKGTGVGIHRGIVASGDLFVADPETKKSIRDYFGASVAEMEGASIAHVAAFADVPFAVLRVISDTADGQAASSFDSFEQETTKRSASVIEEFLRRL
ncbi:MAG: 5'-methylthioadenosine/adenosylhomocysteine nucleosidase [Spirochaetales bacterium]|nr:5'-methylthioadenosine/adenosylhomocysteine nucleosidase [Spirochaetales bacterium]